MQYKDARAKQKEWGDKPCNHSRTEKEYYLGSQTGDTVCTTCGSIVEIAGERLQNVQKNDDLDG